MEAGGRDDFIIAIRSAFLKKETKQRFSLIVLIFFSLILLVLGRQNFKPIDYAKISIREIIYRSSFIISVPENYIKKTYLTIQDHFNFYNEYSKVKSELKKLKAQDRINDFIISENKRLKQVVDDYIVESEEIIAKILIDKESPFLRSIVVNKGSSEGIKLGMAVLDNNYLIGKVVEINFSTARVLLLSDLNSKIPVTIEPGSIEAILSGTGQYSGIIQYTKAKYNLGKENVVYTSGSGGLFKSGIPIGIIENNDLDIEQKVSFFSDFSQLKFVKIVSYETEVTK